MANEKQAGGATLSIGKTQASVAPATADHVVMLKADKEAHDLAVMQFQIDRDALDADRKEFDHQRHVWEMTHAPAETPKPVKLVKMRRIDHDPKGPNEGLIHPDEVPNMHGWRVAE